MKWLFALRDVKQSYQASARMVAVAFLPHVAVGLVVGLLSLIPAPAFSLFVILVGVTALGGASLLGELLLYVGINRTVRFTKSPLLPYVALKLAWTAASGLCVFVLARLLTTIG